MEFTTPAPIGRGLESMTPCIGRGLETITPPPPDSHLLVASLLVVINESPLVKWIPAPLHANSHEIRAHVREYEPAVEGGNCGPNC